MKIERSMNDKRAKELYLSDSGRELYRFMQNLNQQWLNYVLSDLDESNINHFIETIDQISKRAKSYYE